jgi:hypothetical protein
MRFWGPAVVTGAFLFPTALFAQHTAAAAPSHLTPTVAHVSSTPSAVPHVSSNPSTRISGATSPSGARGLQATARTARDPKAPSAKDKEQPRSVASSERRGLFAFLRGRKPGPAGLRSNCRHGRCATNNSIAKTQGATLAPFEARRGCTVVPVSNPALPCSPLSPCCP